MSLSGIDTGAVEAAEKKVLQERGGWFLLYYTSRDTVDVLAQGAKGLAEMRDVAENYYNGTRTPEGQIGPLYGMIDFRRRKILVKLVLEGTSRLVKARVQVHWNSVTTRFANHDTVFEPTACDQLNETGVTAHIDLHSRSSAGSMSKKATLDGISEENGEDGATSPERTPGAGGASKTEESPASTRLDIHGNTSHPKRISSLVNAAAATSAALQQSITDSSQAISVPEVNITAESPILPDAADSSKDDPSGGYTTSQNDPDRFSLLDAAGRRFSTQSARPSTADIYSSSLYDYDSLYKPKVKLGPRPSMDRRPTSSKGQGVASLPAGLRAARPNLNSRPKSRDSTLSGYRVPPPPPIPESSALDFMPRPRSSGNSVKSLPATLPKSPGMTKEKQRLMKFRDMYREKENSRSKGKSPARTSKKKESAASESNPTIDEPKETAIPRTLEASSNSDDPFVGAGPAITTVKGSSGLQRNEELPDDTQEEVAKRASVASTNEAEPRASADSTLALSTTGAASSPTSAVESSAQSTSTRPTSVSEASEQDKSQSEDTDSVALAPDPSMHSSGSGTEVNSPSTIVDERAGSEDVDEPLPVADLNIVASPNDDGIITPTAQATLASISTATDVKEKRRAMVSPITVPIRSSVALSEATLSELEDASYDEDFMDELQDAEVVEAKSMSVSKSPITPFFSRRPSTHLLDSASSNQLPDTKASPLPSCIPINMDRTPSASPTINVVETSPESTSERTTSDIIMNSIPKQHPIEAIEAAEAESEETAASQGVEAVQKETANDNDSEATLQSPIPSQSDPSPTSVQMNRSSSGTLLSPISRTPSSNALNSLDRTSSGTLLSVLPQQQNDTISVPKRMKLGTGVASKIADLQRSFSRGSTGPSTPSPSSAPRSVSGARKSSFISQRASSLQDSAPPLKTPPKSSSSQYHSSQFGKDSAFARGRTLSKGSMKSLESSNSTPPRNHSSGSIAKLDNRRISVYDPLPEIDINNKETISVKATIVRTDGAHKPELVPSTEPKPMNLMESPLVISHQRANSVSPNPMTREQTLGAEGQQSPEQPPSKEKKHKRAASSISQALNLPTLRGFKSPSTATLSDTLSSPSSGREGGSHSRPSLDMGASWRTLTRRASASLSRSPDARSPAAGSSARSPSASRSPTSPTNSNVNGTGFSMARSMSNSSLESTATTESQSNNAGSTKKGSRASRLMKRMSNSMSSIASVTRLQLGTLSEGSSKDERTHDPVAEEEEGRWQSVEVGDLNVQFPDTLLWKRRYVSLDSQGYLVLRPFQPSAQNTASAGSYDRKLERRYHISQFHVPFAPDMERMEMPFSVVLDFREDSDVGGGSLQVASSSGQGQGIVLRVLTEAHRACTS